MNWTKYDTPTARRRAIKDTDILAASSDVTVPLSIFPADAEPESFWTSDWAYLLMAVAGAVVVVSMFVLVAE